MEQIQPQELACAEPFEKEKTVSRVPQIIPAVVAARILIAVIGNPRSEYVARMESKPVVGVEIIKARTAPVEAPLLIMCSERGMTPQEQTGNGIPIIAALITDFTLLPDSCLPMKFSGRKA